MSAPRKHHFVPRFYLGGFTASGSKDDRLFVFDKSTGKQWPSTPGDTGCERDFYMIEIEDGGDPQGLEQLFSQIEEGGAEAIRYMSEHRRLPEGDLYGRLIAFLALMGARVPGAISVVAKPLEQITKTMMQIVTESKERYEALVAGMKADGREVEDIPWEQMRDFARSDDFQVSMSQNYRMKMVLDMSVMIEKLLAARQWSLVAVPKAGPHFICSDRPLTLSWIVDPGHWFFSPGFGMTGTVVSFPVSRELAMVGIFEGRIENKEVDARFVATLNTSTVNSAERFIYSTNEEFTIKLGSGALGGREDLQRLLQEAGNAASAPS